MFNMVAIAICCLIIGVVIVTIRENRKTGAVGMIAAFIVGLAFHSVLLHERVRHNWKFPWDHD